MRGTNNTCIYLHQRTHNHSPTKISKVPENFYQWKPLAISLVYTYKLFFRERNICQSTVLQRKKKKKEQNETYQQL